MSLCGWLPENQHCFLKLQWEVDTCKGGGYYRYKGKRSLAEKEMLLLPFLGDIFGVRIP